MFGLSSEMYCQDSNPREGVIREPSITTMAQFEDSNPREGVILGDFSGNSDARLDSNPREGVIQVNENLIEIQKQRFKPP